MAGSLGRRRLRLWRPPCEGPILLFPCPFCAAAGAGGAGGLAYRLSFRRLEPASGGDRVHDRFPAAGRRGQSFIGGPCFTIYMVLYLASQKSMGTGDLVLSTGAAFWLSPLTALLFIWFSALSALLFLAMPLLLGRKKAGDPVRFGPFIAMGGVMAYGWQEIWGPLLPPWFPFG